VVFTERYLAGKIELELVPQGTLAERIRAGGAGIPAFYTPTSFGTDLAAGKPVEVFEGRSYVRERWLKADVALVKAHLGDTLGNLTYRMAARNFGPADVHGRRPDHRAGVKDRRPRRHRPRGGDHPRHLRAGVVQVENPAQEEDLNRANARYPETAA
jgi:3-oxoadipate CoA-transferase alpha subunit